MLWVQSLFFVFMQYFDLGVRLITISLVAGYVDLEKTLKVTLVQVRSRKETLKKNWPGTVIIKRAVIIF
jgi:hypothetical protein